MAIGWPKSGQVGGRFGARFAVLGEAVRCVAVGEGGGRLGLGFVFRVC